MESLQEIAKQLVVPGKGILAADESVRTAGKRLTAVGLPNTEDLRRQYRDVFLTADGIGQYLSGVILFDETFRQQAATGISFVEQLKKEGVLPGVKVDKSTVPLVNFSGEEVTEGLDGLPERLQEYVDGGAKFTKWRAVIRIGKRMPSKVCLEENARTLARYAAESQAVGLVPIVEPEVLFEGRHSIDRAERITAKTLKTVFKYLSECNVDLKGLILKTSMVLAGDKHKTQSIPEEVAEATIRTLKAAVPAEVGGVVFLSGGQSAQQATANLSAIAKFKDQVPWPMTFSYARALQGSALEVWRGKPENMQAAQQEFLKRLKLVSLAREGKYDPSMEQY